MSYLTGLLAFVAVMTLMSTIVAVMIESFIGMFSMRASGLRKLLRNYYADAIAPRLPASALSGDVKREAEVFAKRMTENPSRQNSLGTQAARLKDLSTRQLVEQMARTDAGKAFLSLPDDALRPHLDALAYEFDRHRDGARMFFTQRTKTVSTIIAIIVALVLNIDAIRLYQGLLANPAAQAASISMLRSPEGQAMLQAARDPSNASVGSAAGSGETNFDPLLQTLSDIGNLTLPIGASQYPYCANSSLLLGDVESNHPAYDPRCEEIHQPQDIASANLTGWKKAQERLALRWNFDTALWLISTLVAGGMIGLGAPFWYGFYQRLAALVPIAGLASSLVSKPGSKTGNAGHHVAVGPPERRADDSVRDPDDLVFAMRATSGDSPVRVSASAPFDGSDRRNIAGSSPPGAHLGEGSAQRVKAVEGDPGPPGTPGQRGIRRLRG